MAAPGDLHRPRACTGESPERGSRLGPRSHPALGPFAHDKPAPGPFPAQPCRDILGTVKDRANRWADDPQKGKGEIMKKVLMVIFVLSLLGLLAVPVLAKVFESGPSNEIAPLPGGLRPAGGEKPVQIAKGGCWLPVEPPYYAPQSAVWAG